MLCELKYIERKTTGNLEVYQEVWGKIEEHHDHLIVTNVNLILRVEVLFGIIKRHMKQKS